MTKLIPFLEIDSKLNPKIEANSRVSSFIQEESLNLLLANKNTKLLIISFVGTPGHSQKYEYLSKLSELLQIQITPNKGLKDGIWIRGQPISIKDKDFKVLLLDLENIDIKNLQKDQQHMNLGIITLLLSSIIVTDFADSPEQIKQSLSNILQDKIEDNAKTEVKDLIGQVYTLQNKKDPKDLVSYITNELQAKNILKCIMTGSFLYKFSEGILKQLSKNSQLKLTKLVNQISSQEARTYLEEKYENLTQKYFQEDEENENLPTEEEQITKLQCIEQTELIKDFINKFGECLQTGEFSKNIEEILTFFESNFSALKNKNLLFSDELCQEFMEEFTETLQIQKIENYDDVETLKNHGINISRVISKFSENYAAECKGPAKFKYFTQIFPNVTVQTYDSQINSLIEFSLTQKTQSDQKINNLMNWLDETKQKLLEVQMQNQMLESFKDSWKQTLQFDLQKQSNEQIVKLEYEVSQLTEQLENEKKEHQYYKDENERLRQQILKFDEELNRLKRKSSYQSADSPQLLSSTSYTGIDRSSQMAFERIIEMKENEIKELRSHLHEEEEKAKKYRNQARQLNQELYQLQEERNCQNLTQSTSSETQEQEQRDQQQQKQYILQLADVQKQKQSFEAALKSQMILVEQTFSRVSELELQLSQAKLKLVSIEHFKHIFGELLPLILYYVKKKIKDIKDDKIVGLLRDIDEDISKIILDSLLEVKFKVRNT